MGLSVERARQLLSAFAHKKVLVVGDAFIDTYVQGEIERLNPESHLVHLLQVSSADSMLYRSGGAGNVARNVCALGGDAMLVSVCGNDTLGRRVKSIAANEGYRADFITDSGRSTIEKRRYVTKDGVLLRVDYENTCSTRPVGEEVVTALLAAVERSLHPVDAVFVSDYAKGLLTPAFCDRLLDLVAKRQVPVMADVKPAHMGSFIGVTMIAPNLKEASESIGKEGKGDPQAIAEALAKRINTEVFLTAGPRGICVAKKDTPACMIAQAHQVKVGDTSGCGDTAAATILLAKLAGATSQEAAELSNAAAAVTVSKVGAYAPTPDEVLRMLES